LPWPTKPKEKEEFLPVVDHSSYALGPHDGPGSEHPEKPEPQVSIAEAPLVEWTIPESGESDLLVLHAVGTPSGGTYAWTGVDKKVCSLSTRSTGQNIKIKPVGKGGFKASVSYDIQGKVAKAVVEVKVEVVPDKVTGARLGERRISQELYKELRAATPTPEIQDMVNKGKIAPFPDEALPGFTVTKRLHADHIVSMDRITKMEGFDKLTRDQQLSVLNNPDNFIGLSTSANTSKGPKTFAEWAVHKKSGTPVDLTFRERMIKIEQDLEIGLQRQIDNFIELNRTN